MFDYLTTAIRIIWSLSKGLSKFLLFLSVSLYITALTLHSLALMQPVAVLTTYSILAFYSARKEQHEIIMLRKEVKKK
jgi:hypothetical protein